MDRPLIGPPWRQIVFSGGGTRCFWHGGFLEVLQNRSPLSPERVIGVSGGALSASAFLAGRERDLLDIMSDAFRAEDSNVTWHDMDEDEGRTPHQRVYREVVTEMLSNAALDRIADGPVFQIFLAHPPSERAPELTGTAMTLAYEAELHLKGSPHFTWPAGLGVTSTRVDARAAARDGRLAELVVAAATIPPVFRLPIWDDRHVIDGGMADQAPMPEPDIGPTLILLTRDYPDMPDAPDRDYVWPSEETPADKIDFTDPEKLAETWQLGNRDGAQFVKNLT